MSKLLIVSDIHIHDYPSRNPENLFRLRQTRTVAQNIIAVGKAEGCDTLVIAGDVLEKSTVRPYIQAEAKLFLDELMKHFNQGMIIFGNHDLDNKSGDQHFNDSCLSVMLPANMFYADKRVTKIDNTTIAFSNWRPEFDLDFISEPVDLLITHATINYGGGDIIKSQVLDESKFGICISGDIHRPAQSGKYISIGIPQKCKMGDSDYCTGVVFDCVTKEWKWVDLNPSNNLMRFIYTPNLDEEGWDADNGIWKVYKRDKKAASVISENVNVPQWEEIDHLVTDILQANDLLETHSEVLSQVKDLSKNEVDFGFVLQRFACKNWRSIDDVELYFDDYDRILITGKNGSGKSSMLSALKYAFVENRSLKDFVQFGSKDCSTEVDFLYQGQIYRIERGYNGSKSTFGLGVFDDAGNLVKMKYNNKREFEADLLLRFPFISYIDDVMFFDPDHNKLLSDIAKKEIDADIISKFFKLDKIDTINEQAVSMLESRTRDVGKWQEEIKLASENLKYIQGRLDMIPVPDMSRDDLLNWKSYYMDIQAKAKAWQDWKNTHSMLVARKGTLEEQLEAKTIARRGCRPIEIIDSELSQIKAQIDNISTIQVPALRGIEGEINLMLRELEALRNQGNVLYNRYADLGKEKVCPTCNRVMDKPSDLDSMKVSLEQQMSEMLGEINRKEEEITRKQQENIDVPSHLESLSETLRQLQVQSGILLSEKNGIRSLEAELENLTNSLNQTINQLNSSLPPEEVEVPEDLIQNLSAIEQKISQWDQIETFRAHYAELEEKARVADEELSKILSQVSNLEKYIKLTGGTGKIFEEIMGRLAEQFSDNQVRYEVYSGKERKKDKLKLLSSFNNNGNWVTYDNCSSGQKTILDIHYLSKIITKMGFLVMDEFLKHLDPLNHDICIDMISQCNVGCVMLSSHMENITKFHNKTCSLELNDNGSTIIKLS